MKADINIGRIMQFIGQLEEQNCTAVVTPKKNRKHHRVVSWLLILYMNKQHNSIKKKI